MDSTMELTEISLVHSFTLFLWLPLLSLFLSLFFSLFPPLPTKSENWDKVQLTEIDWHEITENGKHCIEGGDHDGELCREGNPKPYLIPKP